MTRPPRIESLADTRRRRRIPAGVTLILLLGCLPAAAQPDGHLTVAAVDASTLRDWDRIVDLESRTGGLRRYAAQPNHYLRDRQSERFAQYHEGVPVYGADLIRQTEAGVTTAILGTVFTGIDVDTTPGLTPAEAAAVFDGMSAPPFGLVGAPRLWVLPRGGGGYTLAYEGVLSSFRNVFIDAGTGETLFDVSRVRRQAVGLGTGVLGDQRKMATESIGGTFRTRDPLRPATIRTFDMENDEVGFLSTLLAMIEGMPPPLAALAADDDNVWEDATVVDVHPGIGWSYDYLATQHGWAGIDGRDGDITAFVHPVNAARLETAANQCLENAADPFEECIQYVILLLMIDNALYFRPFPNTSSTGFMVFGEPLELPRPLTALDVVAHEMAHGVTHFTAGLTFPPPPTPNEPGALDEAFSDIMATATEFHVQEPGRGPLRADYLVGEDIGFPLRSLRDPGELQNALTGPYPDHYDDRYLGRLDQGGVHINATILGHAYFLAVEGGTNRTSGLSVTGVGHENRLDIERTFFNAWVNLVPSFADHAIVRQSLIRSATDLFGADAAATRAIREALDAVGIPRASDR